MPQIASLATVKRGPTEADLLLWTHLQELERGSELQREWKFCSGRRWRFDFAFFRAKVAIEIDGGMWSQGRHNRGAGYIKDMEKFNMATHLGWRVLHFTPEQVLDGTAIAFIKQVLEN